MAGRDVDKARSLVHRHEVRRRDRALAVDPRVAERMPDELRPFEESEHAVLGISNHREEIVHACARDDVDLSEGCTAIARLAGRVHGVVVQTTANNGVFPSRGANLVGTVFTRNFT